MNSINDLREIYDELYRRGTAAAAVRTTLPDGVGEELGATSAEPLPVIGLQPVRARRRRERFAPLAAALAITAIVALIGALVFALRPWSHDGKTPAGAQGGVTSSSARCYATADVRRSDNYFSISIGGADGSNPVAAGPHALQLCSDRWREGILSTNPPYKIDSPPDNANLPVPELVACILPADNSDEGVEEVAILPGSVGTCSELGLSVFPGA